MAKDNLPLPPEHIIKNVQDFTQKIFQALRSENFKYKLINSLSELSFTKYYPYSTFTESSFFTVIDDCEINIDTEGTVMIPYVQAEEKGLCSFSSLLYPVTIQKGVIREYIMLTVSPSFKDDIALMASIVIRKHYANLNT